MTISVQRHGDSEVKVNVTYGPVFFTVTEPAGHLRHVWGELGRLLEKIEAESAQPE